MPKYFVRTMVEYSQEVETEDETQAEEMGWDWDDSMYAGVFDITVEETD